MCDYYAMVGYLVRDLTKINESDVQMCGYADDGIVQLINSISFLSTFGFQKHKNNYNNIQQAYGYGNNTVK
jgi:hypothetical protein